ncbi:MAG: hypothetical protein JJ863_24185 [Deltaproteobacteria bacterium]|nr:hypothetical protein [Deltaproteobacteria bacterium]
MARQSDVCRRYEAHGDTLLISLDLDELTDEERSALPAEVEAAFQWWTDAAASRFHDLPESLAWARGELRARRVAVERLVMDGDREYWTFRLPLHGDLDMFERLPAQGSVGRCCPGGDGRCLLRDDVAERLPPSLVWLARAFGTMSLTSEVSGTAPLGWSLGDAIDQEFGLFSMDPETIAQLPVDHRDWVIVYEADGDAIALDPSGAGHWLGWEWTGELVQPLGLDAEALTQVVFWRLLGGGSIRPSDLAMLRSAFPLHN